MIPPKLILLFILLIGVVALIIGVIRFVEYRAADDVKHLNIAKKELGMGIFLFFLSFLASVTFWAYVKSQGNSR